MLVLLPPSEGKTPADDGAPVRLAALGHPGLTAHRSALLDALAKVSAHPDALRVLGVGAGLAAEVERNTRLRTEPAAPASSVYTGVLYAAAGLARLPDDASRARADGSVRVVSALWGLVRPGDSIPAYRLAMGADLPGLGPLARGWRALLAAELDPRAAGELVVDCRSGPYTAAWRPRAGAPGWVAVRVLREVEGRRSVVSHHAKHARGVLTRHLLVRAGHTPTEPAELLVAARELIGTTLPGATPQGTTTLVDADLTPPGSATRPHTLTLTLA